MTKREYVLMRDQFILQQVKRLLFCLHVDQDEHVPHPALLSVRGSVAGWERSIREELGMPSEGDQ